MLEELWYTEKKKKKKNVPSDFGPQNLKLISSIVQNLFSICTVSQYTSYWYRLDFNFVQKQKWACEPLDFTEKKSSANILTLWSITLEKFQFTGNLPIGGKISRSNVLFLQVSEDQCGKKCR